MTNDEPRAGDPRVDQPRPSDADAAPGQGGVIRERGTEIPYRPGRADPGDAGRSVTGLPPDVGDRDPWDGNRPRPVTARGGLLEGADAIPTHEQRQEGRIEPVDGGPREDLDEPAGRAIPGDPRPPERR